MLRTFVFPIKGTFYYEASELCKTQTLAVPCKLSLQAEPDNAYDAFAIQIYYQDYLLGYVPRVLSKKLSPFLSQHPHCELKFYRQKGRLIRMECAYQIPCGFWQSIGLFALSHFSLWLYRLKLLAHNPFFTKDI